MIEALVLLMAAITDLGDSGGLTLLVFTVCAYLAWQGEMREAKLMMAAFIGVSIGTAAAKVLLMGCGSALHTMGLRTPSGHSALSIVTFGTLSLLIGSHLPMKQRFVPLLLLLTLALLIAVSRALLRFHTPQEVLAGICIGFSVLACVAPGYFARERKALSPYAIAYIGVLVLFLTHGYRLHAEDFITRFAGQFKTYAHCT